MPIKLYSSEWWFQHNSTMISQMDIFYKLLQKVPILLKPMPSLIC